MDYDANEGLAHMAAARERAFAALQKAQAENAKYEAEQLAAETRAARWSIVGVLAIFAMGIAIYVWAK